MFWNVFLNLTMIFKSKLDVCTFSIMLKTTFKFLLFLFFINFIYKTFLNSIIICHFCRIIQTIGIADTNVLQYDNIVSWFGMI